MPEEPAHPQEFSIAIDNLLTLFRLKFCPRNFEGDISLSGVALQIGEQGTILRLSPWINGAIVQRLRFVRDHAIEVEVDGISESLAARASAKRIVKREKMWLRF